MKDIDKAVTMLEEERLTLAIVKDNNIIFTSSEKGIKPLFTAVKKYKQELKNASVADRVTGKAAAMLCDYVGIKQLKTKLISENAVNYLEKTNIIYEFNEKTPYIKNRDKTGMCPIETLSLKSDSIFELIKHIESFLEEIEKGKK